MELTLEYLPQPVVSRRRRSPPLYGRDIRFSADRCKREDSASCECMKLFIKKSGTMWKYNLSSLYRNVGDGRFFCIPEKQRYSVLIFLYIKMLQEDGKSSKLSCLFCSLQRNLLYIFFLKRYCSAYCRNILENMNGTVSENGFSLCFCSF